MRLRLVACATVWRHFGATTETLLKIPARFLLGIGLAAMLVCSPVQAQVQQIEVPIHVQPDGRIFVDVTMNGKHVSALLDTGANIAVVTKSVKLTNTQFHAGTVGDFHSNGSMALQGRVDICLTDAKSSCIEVDGIQDRQAQDNIVPVTVLEQVGSHVEMDFKTKTLILSN